MNKKTILYSAVLLFLTNPALANDKKINSDLLEPENIGKMLDVAIEKSKQESQEISRLYHEYKDVFAKYADEYIPVFRQYFSEEDGQADEGYVNVRIVD